MKILQVIPYFCFGGAETMCENLTYALTDLGHQVTVVSLYNEKTPISQRMEEKGIRILYLDKKLGLDLSMVSKLRRIMKAEKPDVVHTHLDVIKYAVAAAKLCGIGNCIHTVHNVADKEAEGRIQKIINTVYFKLGWCRPVALSPQVKDTIVSFYSLPEKNVPVIFNGVDLSRCMPKEQYSVGETLNLLHVGRFNEQKNHEGLLRAYALFREQYPNSKLHLIGDGELVEQTKQLAKELSLAGHICFLGSQSNVYPYLQNADLFLLPSHYEGMPMTIIEAMGTGLPIVASNVGGIPDMIEDGKSGLLTGTEPNEICQAWLCLAGDESLRMHLGQQAKDDSQRFAAGYMAQRYLEEYKH